MMERRCSAPSSGSSANRPLKTGGMVIAQGDVCWADLPDPTGSGPGFRRPVVVIQGNPLNRSRVATVVCVPLTSNLRWADGGENRWSSKTSHASHGDETRREFHDADP